MNLDHVLVAVADLDAAAERFAREFALASIAGGRHEGIGTANRLVPLGDQYIELIAVVDATSDHPVAQFVAATAAGGDTLMGVSLAVDDIDATAARIGSGVVPMTRDTGTGVVSFAVTGMEVALGPERLPFFIEWGENAALRLPGAGAGNSARLAWVELGGDQERAREWLGGADVAGLRLVGGPPGTHRAAVTAGGGEVVLS